MGDTPKRDGRSNTKRTRRQNDKPFVVGIGASAGGIQALEDFFEHMPDTSGMAFVAILHLSPDYESNLAAMLQRKTGMPVVQITETVKVEPNHVYVIPPAKHLVMSDGMITLKEPEEERGKRVPIDLFFRTLADAYSIHAIGIVLSGTGTDGTLGLKRIKEVGGISMAQDPQEAEYDGMLRSAIESGMVDFILPVSQMPEKLRAIRQVSEAIKLPPEGPNPPTGTEAEALREILTFLRVRTGHDFSNYKQSTILRRVTRRMQMDAAVDLSAYLRFVREHPAEVRELLSDLLINVTNFFRDTKAFEFLEREVVPKLFADKAETDQARVWVTGCATGEEAYSLAMLLQEYAQKLDRTVGMQIFATDIDEDSINHAREGIYPESIIADVSPERLKRFFNKEGHHYRIKEELREMVLFAPHNILRDPPFSKLDLISCRNLLIYLNRETQARVLELFHFALRPNGFLFLGSSETADNLPELFTPFDKKLRIFQRSVFSHTTPYIPAMPVKGKWEVRIPETATPQPRQGLSYGELHQILVEQYAPPSVLINAGYDIVHLSETAGRYLRFSGGEPSRNLLKVVHPDLRLDLRAALFAATQEGHASETHRVAVSLGGESRFVSVMVRPIIKPDAARGYLLVMFREHDEQKTSSGVSTELQPDTPSHGEMDSVVRRLEEELQRTKEQLRATIEQYETSTEELKASNEELQSMNEELRTATEELETSKEELQSVNEELMTVNIELKEKIDEISRANSDLQNLMHSTPFGTMFLDREMRIKRFTPPAAKLINIIPSDVGRPIAHFTHKLAYDDLPQDAEYVLQTLTRVEREICSTEGRWYIAQLSPYRTVEDKIDGVVLTFVDITERKKAEEEHRRLNEELRRSEEHLRLLFESVKDYAIFTLDLEGYVNSWNSGAEQMFGYTAEEVIGQSGDIMFTPEDREHDVPRKEREKAMTEGGADDERWHLRKDGTRFYASGVLTPLRHGEVRGYVKILRDLTERKQMEEDLRRTRDELEVRVKERTRELELSYWALQAQVAERRAAEEQVKELLRRIVSTQELERQRISRDLHDHLGQQLTALRLKLQSLKEQCGGQSDLCKQVEQTQTLAERLDADVDFLAWELRPSALDELGLIAALESFIQEWSKHFGITAEFHTTGLTAARFPSEVEINLYRIAQEALNNVMKHAEASRVDVIIEQRNQNTLLIIEDNGKGFDPQEEMSSDKGLGLIGMRERASLMGGALEIESATGEGTTIFVRVPVRSGK